MQGIATSRTRNAECTLHAEDFPKAAISAVSLPMKPSPFLIAPFARIASAKAFSSSALARGLRVEAGTLPGIEPKLRMGWRAAHHWAQSSNERAIMNLNKRLLEAVSRDSIARQADAKRPVPGTTR